MTARLMCRCHGQNRLIADYYVWQKHVETEAKLQQAIVLSEQHAQNKNVLQNKLDLSNQCATD
ncbi:hypothetical protein [Pelosinus fermentans]|uniref:hypothetical protein n=1 Tax=Pelosinus fermentans TaxID=365349 RepID=UPI00130E76F8|nr:hypothetical protein [Pelosinus fermentans]